MKGKISWALILGLIPLFVSGCILLEPHRLRDFSGPSWEVPISIPVIPLTRFDLSGLEFIANPDHEIGLGYSVEPFPVYSFSVSGSIDMPAVTVRNAEPIEVSLHGLEDLPDVQLLAAQLTLTIENVPGVDGELGLTITGLREGAVDVSITRSESLLQGEPFTIDLGELVNRTPRPDSVRLEYTAHLPAQTVDVQAGDKVSVHAQVWLPLYLNVREGSLDWDMGSAMELELGDDAKATLADARLADLAFVVDVTNHFPIGFDIELLFSSSPEPGAEAVSVPIQVPNGVIDKTGRVIEPSLTTVELPVSDALRGVLTGQQVYVTPKFSIYNDTAGPGGVGVRFAIDDYIALQGYGIVTLGINQ